MDHRQISEFVNSKDVRKYLQDIGYEFSTPQAAWLVHQCQRLTMEERHKAWREIIRDMPDCAMEERLNLKRIDSFHAFLRDYMEMGKRNVQEFVSGNHCVYSTEYHEMCSKRGERDELWWDGDGFFTSYQACMDSVRRELTEETDIDRIRILKYGLDSSAHEMCQREGLLLNSNLEILNVSPRCKNKDEQVLAWAFDGMCFDFPTPFWRGDILVDCTAYGSPRYVPFVLSRIATWNSEEMLSSGFGESDCPDTRGWEYFDKVVEERLKAGDFTDGGVIGTAVCESDESLERDLHIGGLTLPTDLEYYRGPLKGAERQLKVLSYYEKGELDEAGLVNLCCAIRMEDIGRRCTWEYTDEFLESIGLRPKK